MKVEWPVRLAKLLPRFGVAIVTFVLGVSVSTIFIFLSAPEVQMFEGPTPSACFPGLSVEVKKPGPVSRYFPIALSQDDHEDQLRTDWYSKYLRAMNERALPSSTNEEESYRFLWLRSFHQPIAVHVWRSGASHFIGVKELSGAAGYEPTTLVLDEVRSLSDAEWDRLMSQLEETSYWAMPTRDDRTFFDGAQWILEGYRQGRYHIVDRQSPELGSYRQACLCLLELSGMLRKIPHEEIY